MSSSQRGGRCEPLSGIISSFKSPPLSFASCQGSQLLCKSLLHKNIEQLANNIPQKGCSGDQRKHMFHQWESWRFKSKVVWSLLASFGISVSFLGSLLTHVHMNLSNIGRGAFPRWGSRRREKTAVSCELPPISLLWGHSEKVGSWEMLWYYLPPFDWYIRFIASLPPCQTN